MAKKFYVFDPMITPAFSKEFDNIEDAAKHAAQIQWRNKSFGVEVLAVAATIGPKLDPEMFTVSSEYTDAFPMLSDGKNKETDGGN